MWESKIYVPPGWPRQVHPPGAPGWEATASAFLLDCCPADYRAYQVLRRHPVVLARFAAEYVEGAIRAGRGGVAGIRARLAGVVDAAVADAAVEAWHEELARLACTQRAVRLVEEALRGEVFTPKL